MEIIHPTNSSGVLFDYENIHGLKFNVRKGFLFISISMNNHEYVLSYNYVL
jgi:hypothetical protein